ncbi:MAG: glycosyltransferase family 39 protein [Calditrichia bacterium]
MPGWVQPPVYPLMSGFFSLIIPTAWSGIVVDVIFSLAIAAVLFKFIRNHFSTELSLVAVVLLVGNPLFIYSTSQSITEPVFAFFHFLVFIILYGILFKSEYERKHVIYLGIISFLMVLTRPEGLLFSIFIFLFLLFRSGYTKRAFLYLAVFVVLMMPYGFLIQSVGGSFNITPKITYNKRLGTAIVNYLRDHPQNPRDMVSLTRIGWQGYDPVIEDTYSSRIMNNDYYLELKRRINKNPIEIKK